MLRGARVSAESSPPICGLHRERAEPDIRDLFSPPRARELHSTLSHPPPSSRPPLLPGSSRANNDAFVHALRGIDIGLHANDYCLMPGPLAPKCNANWDSDEPLRGRVSPVSRVFSVRNSDRPRHSPVLTLV